LVQSPRREAAEYIQGRQHLRSREVPLLSIQSINPATGEVLERFEETSAPLERILAGADAAFRQRAERLA
jgi:acyl-CoA reductase-like NAD-dependent aldehyde dehydrogenase